MCNSPAFFKQEDLTGQVSALSDYIKQCAHEGVAAHSVEHGIWKQVLAMGRTAFSGFLALCGTGDLGAEIKGSDGRCLRRLNHLHERPYVSIFGEFIVPRVVYGTGERKRIQSAPLDERLRLPEGKFSYVLQDWDQSLVVEMPYAKVNTMLERILGFSQSLDSLERANRKLSESVAAFWDALPIPAAAEEGELLVCSADGKGVPIRGAQKEARIRDHQPKRGPKPDRMKMALVGSIYTVDRYPRTPEAIIEALFRNPGQGEPPPARPQPQHKHIRASLIRDEAGTSSPSYEEIFRWMGREATERNRDVHKPVILLMDGQESLWNAGAEALANTGVTEILDVVHASSYLWKAAHLFHPRGSDEAEHFVKQRMTMVLNGKVRSVIRGLRRMGSLHQLRKRKTEKLRKICGYFENNQSRMNYHTYLAQGYPIASGIIEGACRNLAKDRMERSGMRWILEGAHAMLGLRSVFLGGLWDRFIQFRIEKESTRLYPNRATNTLPIELLAA